MSMFAAMGQGWKNAETAQDVRELPDGEYVFRIVSAKGKTTMSGATVIEWMLETKIDEEMVQTRKTSFWSEKGFPVLKRDIAALDVDPDTIDAMYMELWLEYFADAFVWGRVVNTSRDEKKYNNIYFDKLFAPIANKKPEQKPESIGFEQTEDALPWD